MSGSDHDKNERLRRRVRELEAALQESETRFDSLFHNRHAVMLLIDPDTGAILDANPAACAFYGWTRAEMVRMKITDINVLTPEEIFHEMADARGRKRRHFFFRHRLADGEVRHVEVYSGPIRIDGRDALYSIVADVTEQRRTEAALRDQQAALERMTGELRERVKELNCLFNISKLVEQPDISMPEILEITVHLLPPAWRHPGRAVARITLDRHDFSTDRFRKTPWTLQAPIAVRGQERGRVTVGYLEIDPSDAGGPFLLEERDLIGTVAERLSRIVERKESERDLRESEERCRKLVEHAHTGIAILQEGKVVYANPEHRRLMGPGDRIRFEAVHPEDRDKAVRYLDAVARLESGPLDIELRLTPNGTAGDKATLEPLDVRWVTCRGSLLDYGGKPAVLLNMMDITRAKRLEGLLRIQDKMTTLGRVAAGLAHEIRNPLSGINIYLNALEKRLQPEICEAEAGPILEEIRNASNKIEAVIKRVLDFSKPSMPRFVRTGLNDAVADALRLLSVTLRKNGVTLEKQLSPDLPSCRADPQLLEAAILNLLANAVQAMDGMGADKRVRIATSRAGDRLRLTVSDAGPGIPAHLRAAIFDPFYTTKSDSSGIGLNICQRIVKDHGGVLLLEDGDLGGAAFTIELAADENGPTA